MYLVKTLGCALQRLQILNMHDTKLLAYKTLIRPVFEISSIVWCPFQQFDVKTVDEVREKATQFICSQYDRTCSFSPALQNPGLETLALIWGTDGVCFFHRAINNN